VVRGRRGRAGRTAALAAAAALALAAGGCRKSEEGPSAPASELGGEAVKFIRSYPAGTSGGFDRPLRTVVRDAAMLEEVWKKAQSAMAPVPKAPPLDFTKEMAILAAMGTRPTSGYSIEVVSVNEEGGKMVVWVAERSPGKEEIVTQVVTSPWHLVVLPRRDLPVEWKEYVPPTAPAKKK